MPMIAGRARQHRADQEAERHLPAEQEADEHEDHHADHGDGGVLAVEIGGAPSWMAAAISCMRAVPASAASTDRMV